MIAKLLSSPQPDPPPFRPMIDDTALLRKMALYNCTCREAKEFYLEVHQCLTLHEETTTSSSVLVHLNGLAWPGSNLWVWQVPVLSNLCKKTGLFDSKWKVTCSRLSKIVSMCFNCACKTHLMSPRNWHDIPFKVFPHLMMTWAWPILWNHHAERLTTSVAHKWSPGHKAVESLRECSRSDRNAAPPTATCYQNGTIKPMLLRPHGYWVWASSSSGLGASYGESKPGLPLQSWFDLS